MQMLTYLKSAISRETMDEFVFEALTEKGTAGSSIADMFLDDVDSYLEGSEDDKEIKSLVARIPEFNGEISMDEMEEMEAKAVSQLPLTVLGEQYKVFQYLALESSYDECDDDCDGENYDDDYGYEGEIEDCEETSKDMDDLFEEEY